MKFLLVIQLQPFTMWISNICSQGREEDNDFKKENGNEIMSAFMEFSFSKFQTLYYVQKVFSP